MSEPPKRIIAEKSRTVRRRYQRSNKRFQFTPSQIARIERDEQRENRAKQLREKEKKRIANKKKKTQKETQDREERRRLRLPDPNAIPVPSSQPLLSKFLAKPKPKLSPAYTEQESELESTTKNDSGVQCEVDVGSDTEPDSLGSPGSLGSVEAEPDPFDMLDDEDADAEEAQAEAKTAMFRNRTAPIDSAKDDHVNDSTGYNDHGHSDRQGPNGDEEGDDDNCDEFSECSAFYDEDFMKEVETAAATENGGNTQKTPRTAPRFSEQLAKPALEESFRDDTVDVLEALAGDFDEDQDDEFEKDLLQLAAG